MCDDIGQSTRLICQARTHCYLAGTARQAEIRPDIPLSVLPFARTQCLSKMPTEGANKLGGLSSSNANRDAFDGDDLQLDDFLTVSELREKRQKSLRLNSLLPDEGDWLSIHSSSPSSSQGVSKTSHSKGKEWITDMAQQNHEVDEPTRLPNGNWACNHKCKDKTR